MNDLRQVAILGLGLIGGSISLAILRSFTQINVVGYTHKPSTRNKARQLTMTSERQADDAD